MADVLRRIFDAKDIEEICVCTKDLSFLLHATGCRKDIKDRDIRRVLQCHWDLKAEANSYTYTTYEPAGIDSYKETQKIGRFYTVQRNLIEKITFQDFKKREKITNIIFDDCDEFDERTNNQRVTEKWHLITLI